VGMRAVPSKKLEGTFEFKHAGIPCFGKSETGDVIWHKFDFP
jgi:hypothetical protein